MKNSLKFNNDTFRVMLVGDPHESPKDKSDEDKAKIADYLALQYAAVTELKPDLVILMGDNAKGKDTDELRKVLLRITKPYADHNIPFAFILGNHDLECEVNDINVQYDVYRTLPCCVLPCKDEVNSFGDYFLTIKNDDETEDIFNFWLMYSGSGAAKEYYSCYDFVKAEQIRWYEEKSEELKLLNNKTVPSMVIQHIPVPEEFRLLKERSFLSMIADGVTGQNEQKGKFYTLDKKKTVGYMGEAPCTSGYNSGQFKSWKKTGNVIAAFFGHDHMNDFIGDVDGITLGQCKTAGFRPYGDGLMQGVRIIDIKKDIPTEFDTKMVYYRDLIGTECHSIHGAEKVLRDRISVKLDVLKAVIKYTAPVILPIAAIKIIKSIKK
ncbi:MAG: metallophosphoesterase [Clostridia bacterium]|nr:metallophosphoesterase [Clostridia bacterium]